MFRACFAIFISASCFFLACSHADAAVDAASVNRAIDRGITYLRKSQTDRGGWDEFPGHSCGVSSLCTLSLLNAGVSREDPAIKNAMRYLRSNEAHDTYSLSLQTLVYCQYGATGDLPRIRANVARLSETQIQQGRNSGAWGYGGKRQTNGDPSNAQFALLALGAAVDRGVDVDAELFERAIDYWTRRQSAGGGWSYGGGPASGSMTCAGIASLIIANGRLGNQSSSVEKGQILCCGGSDKNAPIQQGLDWLSERFNAQTNPGGHGGTFFYYLYAIERTGRLTGRRFFGDHDWYREGAEKLLSSQDGFQGYWSGDSSGESPTIATSFALLFLSKGKRQVVIGSLQQDQVAASQWQPHPDALRQLVRHVERSWRRDLTWQTVKMKNATVTDLLQTPVMVISGQDALRIDDSESQLLKEYIDQGGTILFDASGGSGCGSAEAFEKSVAKLCAQWYPDAPLQRLPPTHPVWSAERNVDLGALPDGFMIYGVQACCRTAVFFVPRSVTCRWELADRLFHRGDSEDPVRRQIDHSIRIGQNIIAYATGRELKDKLDAQIVLRADQITASQRGSTQIASLALGAGGEDARRALPNAATIIRKQAQVAVVVPDSPIGFDIDALSEVTVLWMHGRRDFRLSPNQRAALRTFLQRDGVICGTAICGEEPFATAFRREMGMVLGQGLPKSPLKSMPADHPMLTPAYNGYDIRNVTIRRIAQGSGGRQVRRQTSPPILEYAENDDGMVSVVFSPLDLSCALESQNSVQCPGYGTEDAIKIVTNIVQMTLNQ